MIYSLVEDKSISMEKGAQKAWDKCGKAAS